MTKFKFIECSKGQGVARIALSRPPANALTREFAKELLDVLCESNADHEVNVRVIVGKGRFFSTGLDLKTVDPEKLSEIRDLIQSYLNPILIHFLGKTKFVISAVNGPAVGAGAGIAVGANLTYMAESAYLSFPFVKLGLIPDALSTHSVPFTVGYKRAMEIFALGDKIPARNSFEMGLANGVYADADFERIVFEKAVELAKRDPTALTMTKLMLELSKWNTMAPEMAVLEQIAQSECLELPAFFAAVRELLGNKS